MEGQMIGQYRVTGVLGQGGMGIVYAAEHTLLDRPAAVKVLRQKVSSKQDIVTRFFNEARAAAAIRHPGIVAIHEFGWTDDGAAFIVMEYLEGETLRARRKRALPQWNASLSIVRQVAGALAAAHAKGIVHRDLKPDNIFLVPDPEVPGGERIKLIDFGIARLVGLMPSHHKTRTGTVIGTPTYMSPEQCRGVAVDSRADIYALGCILFELCTGRPPFVAQTTGDVLAAHINEPPPTIASLVSGVPQQLEALVQRMLAKAPADRVQTAGELIRLIDEAKAAIGPSARSGAHPVLAALPPLEDASEDERDGETSVDPTALLDTGSAPTRLEGSPQRLLRPDTARPDTARPAPATRKGGFEAPAAPKAPKALAAAKAPKAPAAPMAPADSAALQVPIPSQLDTTLSSAVGTRARASTQSPSRRIAVFGVAGALVLGVVTALGLSTRGDEAPAELAASSSQAMPPPERAAASPPGEAATQSPQPVAPPIASPAPPGSPEQAPSPPAPAPSQMAAPAPSADSKSPPAPTSASPAGAASPTAPTKARSRDAATAARASKPSQPATIQITVDSTPRGAMVVLAGTDLGETPWVGHVPRGDSLIKLVLRLAGHQQQVLLIRPNKANAYKAPLEPLPPAQPTAATATATAGAPAAAPAP